ncbi:MAG: DUF4282 domain-containing protein, partial [Stenotrophobium sp.]
RWADVRSGVAEILRGLADVQLHHIITTAMAPTIYVLAASGVVAINLYLAVEAFQQSLTSGLVWLILIMPITSVAGIVTVRVVLESLLSLFRIVVYMETLMERLQTLQGQTESIADKVEELPLPRIHFWRSSRKRETPVQKEESKNGEGDHGASKG